MTDSIFDQQDDVDYLAELTKPGGKFDRTKYTSEQDMYKAIAKSTVHGDRFIEHKNHEFDQLREDALKWRNESTTQAKLEELLTRMENRVNSNATNNTDGNVQPQLDLTKIEELATAKAIAAVQQLETQKKEAANLAVVESRIRERFGENSGSILRDKLNSLGMTSEDLKLLAKKSPEAVINALEIGNQQPTQSWGVTSSNTRSDSFKPSRDVRDAVFYEKLRRENPKEYYSEKVSVQRLKDMEHKDFMTRLDAQNNNSF